MMLDDTLSSPTSGDGDDVNDDEDDEESTDMENFAVSGMLDEHDKFAAVAPKKLAKAKREFPEGEIIHTRTYDLHITYDKYYQTPRLWIFGYDEVRSN